MCKIFRLFLTALCLFCWFLQVPYYAAAEGRGANALRGIQSANNVIQIPLVTNASAVVAWIAVPDVLPQGELVLVSGVVTINSTITATISTTISAPQIMFIKPNVASRVYVRFASNSAKDRRLYVHYVSSDGAANDVSGAPFVGDVVTVTVGDTSPSSFTVFTPTQNINLQVYDSVITTTRVLTGGHPTPVFTADWVFWRASADGAFIKIVDNSQKWKTFELQCEPYIGFEESGCNRGEGQKYEFANRNFLANVKK